MGPLNSKEVKDIDNEVIDEVVTTTRREQISESEESSPASSKLIEPESLIMRPKGLADYDYVDEIFHFELWWFESVPSVSRQGSQHHNDLDDDFGRIYHVCL
ncbi:hypothetical protein AgCh_022887 [Apium graveolens]